MQYPLVTEYIQSIQNAADNLDKLSNLSPVLDNHGEPYRSSGAFAVVFKMHDTKTGKYYALKCFTEEQPRREEAYKLIADELEMTGSNYVTSVRYLEKELFVDSSCENDEFPVLLMDWVEGETMEAYILQYYADQEKMAMLCFRFCQLAAWLRSQSFAHGDIKPDNIIVQSDGSLTLVDYDGMFVPAMKGWTSPTIGTKDFCHPLRTEKDFDETIDDFSLASIALSLKAISLDSSLFKKHGAADRLLFSANDYLDLSKCEVIKDIHSLTYDTDMNTLLSSFLIANATNNLAAVSFRLFNISKPKIKEKEPEEVLSTEVTAENLANAITDEYGAQYSRDGKKLLNVPYGMKGVYTIRKGTKCICSWAFRTCRYLKEVTIPDSVTSIGDWAFYECSGLKEVTIPNSVTWIGHSAFEWCRGLKGITIPENVTHIDGNPFSSTHVKLYCKSPYFIVDNNILFNKEKTILISFLSNAKVYSIPEGVICIRNRAFKHCKGLTEVTIPDGVTSIEEEAFKLCIGLTEITIPNSVTSIESRAFSGCDCLKEVTIPNSVTCIRDGTFSGCHGLKEITIPDSVTCIGDYAFQYCKELTEVNIPNSVTKIEGWTFRECMCLKKVTISESVTSIGNRMFYGCRCLKEITIPESVTSIESEAFKFTGLTEITIPNSVTSIKSEAFSGCSGLTEVTIPNSVTSIGGGAFYGCSGLTKVTIPNSVTCIGGSMFSGCSGLTKVTIPDGVTSIGNEVFKGCSGLTEVTIPNSVTSIGWGVRLSYNIMYGAFSECDGLTQINIPQGTYDKFSNMLPEYKDLLKEQ